MKRSLVSTDPSEPDGNVCVFPEHDDICIKIGKALLIKGNADSIQDVHALSLTCLAFRTALLNTVLTEISLAPFIKSLSIAMYVDKPYSDVESQQISIGYIAPLLDLIYYAETSFYVAKGIDKVTIRRWLSYIIRLINDACLCFYIGAKTLAAISDCLLFLTEHMEELHVFSQLEALVMLYQMTINFERHKIIKKELALVCQLASVALEKKKREIIKT